MGLTGQELPKESKELSNKLALSLNIDPVEAYQLLVQKMKIDS